VASIDRTLALSAGVTVGQRVGGMIAQPSPTVSATILRSCATTVVQPSPHPRAAHSKAQAPATVSVGLWSIERTLALSVGWTVGGTVWRDGGTVGNVQPWKMDGMESTSNYSIGTVI
jgi:hypothetical protein